MYARDLMTPNPHVVTGSEPVSHAAQIMRDFNVGMVPVVDDRAHLHARGVITDRDIVIRVVAAKQPLDRPIEEFMTNGHLETVTPDTSVQEVMRRMAGDQVRRLLVVDNERIVGIIAQADVALKEGPRAPLRVEEMLERISEPALLAR
jgi:CBS domain-containing protein